MTSRLHGTKLSGSQQSFLKRRLFSLSNDGREVWATVLFLSAIMHSSTCQIFSSFLAIFQDNGLLRFRNFFTMAT